MIITKVRLVASVVGEGKEVVIGKGLLEGSWGLAVFCCLTWHFTCLCILVFLENGALCFMPSAVWMMYLIVKYKY